MSDLTLFFKDISKTDIPKVGGKGANLGEMYNAGFPVPPGFAVTVASYDLFLTENKLLEKITEILKDTDVNNTESLAKASEKIQKLIIKSDIPEDVANDTIRSYKKISGFFKQALVAVRSSATAEDLPDASFAGQQATFLNVKGEANLLIKIRECWASLFTERAIFYRVQNKIPHEKVKISVIIQKMIQSYVSGVMFTIDPVTNEKDRIIIESVWGLGEMIVQGSVVPDHYVVQKGTNAILSKEVSDQHIQLVKEGVVTKERDVPKSQIPLQKISNEEIIKLAKIGQKLQDHYYHPQDVEWAKEGDNLYIVQTRPVTTIKETTKTIRREARTKKLGDEDITLPEKPILIGSPASVGIGTGRVKIIKTPKEIGKMQTGDVLVSKMTSPDFVPAMKKASAIITDEGGPTSHAAIVSRELGVPCVVGTKVATTLLKEGYAVTVDGAKGTVYLGSKVKIQESEQKVDLNKKYAHTKTATKIYVNLAEPERAKEVSKLNVQGVGLLRAEFMIAEIGIHPKEAIKQKKQASFIDKLAKDITIFCKNFYPRPVVYRATDFKTNEYRALPGGKAWEPVEPNPLMGFRGAFRYVTSPEVFNLELQAIKKVREKYNNLWLMTPYVRSVDELARVRRLVATEGLFESNTFKFLMMVEIPVNVILIEEFIKVGIDGVSIGSNDLTMLTLGTDRDNAEVRGAYNERSEAILWSLKRVIKTCNKYKITSSICGQAPSTYDDLVKKLVKYGITSISVNPDAVGRVRGVVAQIEEELIK
ncbi:MAG: phosphoenolpyruvate synthase [Candidatus Woesebacteria bacterium]|nr:MAG: phosphoenolpyruvate synthase [Candidatus Woesebacteria bacterium]